MSVSEHVERWVLAEDTWESADLPPELSLCAEHDDRAVIVLPANANTVERTRLAVSERIALARRRAEADGRSPVPCVLRVCATATTYTLVSCVESIAVTLALTARGLPLYKRSAGDRSR